MPKYGKDAAWIFGIIVVMAKIVYGYRRGHPCSVGVAGPNVVGVPIIEAEKCTQTDITCMMMINDDLPTSYFKCVAKNDVE